MDMNLATLQLGHGGAWSNTFQSKSGM